MSSTQYKPQTKFPYFYWSTIFYFFFTRCFYFLPFFHFSLLFFYECVCVCVFDCYVTLLAIAIVVHENVISRKSGIKRRDREKWHQTEKVIIIIRRILMHTNQHHHHHQSTFYFAHKKVVFVYKVFECSSCFFGFYEAQHETFHINFAHKSAFFCCTFCYCRCVTV